MLTNQPSGAGNFSLNRRVRTHDGLVSKLHAAPAHSSQASHRLKKTQTKQTNKNKPNQKEITVALTRSPLLQTRHANSRWPVRNQGQVSKAHRTCFNKSSASRTYRRCLSSTADIFAYIPALCQPDSTKKQQKAVCDMPKRA